MELSSKLRGSVAGMHGIFDHTGNVDDFMQFFINSKNKAIRENKKVDFNRKILAEFYEKYDDVLEFVEYITIDESADSENLEMLKKIVRRAFPFEFKTVVVLEEVEDDRTWIEIILSRHEFDLTKSEAKESIKRANITVLIWQSIIDFGEEKLGIKTVKAYPMDYILCRIKFV